MAYKVFSRRTRSKSQRVRRRSKSSSIRFLNFETAYFRSVLSISGTCQHEEKETISITIYHISFERIHDIKRSHAGNYLIGNVACLIKLNFFACAAAGFKLTRKIARLVCNHSFNLLLHHLSARQVAFTFAACDGQCKKMLFLG